MELEKQELEPVQAPDQPEPIVVVSTEEPVKEQDEWKAPQSKEEFQTLIKSAENKKATEILKALDVTSVKEFKQLKEKVNQDMLSHESLVKERDEYANKYDSLVKEIENLKIEKVLDKYNVQAEYKEDLIKLAREKVSEDTPFESVLKEMVEGRYKYTVSNSTKFKIGVEKQDENLNILSGVEKAFLARNPNIKK